MRVKRIVCRLLCLAMLVGLLAGCGGKTPGAASGSLTENQPVLLHAGARVVADGAVNRMDIYEKDGRWYLSAQDMNVLFGGDFAEPFVDLDCYAAAADIRYTQDAMLSAAYFNTWERYTGSSVDLALFQGYITQLGLSTEKAAQETVTGKEMAEMLDTFVAWAAPEKLAAWQTLYPAFRSYAQPLTRMDAMAAIFLAAQHVGGRFSALAYSVDNVDMELMALMQKDGDIPNMDLFGWGTFDLGDYGVDHCGIGEVCYNLINFCSIDGSYPMAYDRISDSFRMYDKVTGAEALAALLRVVAMRSGGYAPIDDPAALAPSDTLTQAHLEKAQANPVMTAQTSPILQGFIGGMEYTGGATTVLPEDLILTANWGFNTYGLKFDYVTFFDEAVENANLNNLAYLDGMVATAIENNLHLCLIATTLPGRTAGHSVEDYSSTGDFDLFLNPEKQALANRVWAVLAERYKDIPSANLSFCPFWEATNRNLSTGLPAPDYTTQDIADYLSSAVDAIRGKDADRMILYEPCSGREAVEEWLPCHRVAEQKGNMLILGNYAAEPFVYASMTAEEGQNIDNNNHSTALPQYPTYYYELDDFITSDQPLTFDGFLPAGTAINIHLDRSAATAIEFYADGSLIHSEKVAEAEYQGSYPLSGYIPFAASEKVIRVTLPETAEQVTVTPGYDKYFAWRGIEVVLPEEYIQKKWYYATAYDVFLGVEEKEGLTQRDTSTVLIYPTGGSDISAATIHEDLTFTTAKVSHEASAKTINAFLDAQGGFESQWIFRYEDATFTGMIWSEVKEYYTDLLQGFSDRAFSWLSNDWNNLTSYSPADLAGSRTVEYMGYGSFNLELLQLLQSFQK